MVTMESKDLITVNPTMIRVIRDSEIIEIERTETIKGKKVKKIEKKKLINYFFDEKYLLLLRALKDGPYTLPELTERYNKVVEEPRKKITVYTYLQELTKAGIAIQVGKRLTQKEDNKITTDTLYNRSAKMFYPTIVSEEFWEEKERDEQLRKVLHLTKLYTKNKSITKNEIKALLTKVYRIVEKEIASFLEENIDEVNDLFQEGVFQEMDDVLRAFDLVITALNIDKYKEELNSLKK